MKKHIFIIIGLILVNAGLIGQTSLEGKVTEIATGTPILIGANN